MTTLFSDDEPVEIEPGRGDLRYSSMPLASWTGASGPLIGGRTVSYAQIFESQAWVAIAVMRLLTWSVRVPLKVYRRTEDNERVQLRDGEHRLATAVNAPWLHGFAAQLVCSLLGPLLVHGNALLRVQDGAGGVLDFRRMDWRCITPIYSEPMDDSSEILGWKEHLPRGGETIIPRTEFVHVRWWSPLGESGVSPLAQLRSTLTAEAAATDWTVNNLANSARPHGLVELDDKFLGLEPDERQLLLDQARTDLREAYSGPQMAGKLPVLPPGMKWTTADHTTAVEAELIKQREVNRNEVAAIYMVPPPTIGILEHATYSNITEQVRMAYTDGLAPPLVLIEKFLTAAIARDMLREPDVYLEFDFAGILRGDRLREIQALRNAIQTGLMTPHEGRDVLNLPRTPSEKADQLWMPVNNLRPIDEDPRRPSGSDS